VKPEGKLASQESPSQPKIKLKNDGLIIKNPIEATNESTIHAKGLKHCWHLIGLNSLYHITPIINPQETNHSAIRCI
jgi:hypothetical protein